MLTADAAILVLSLGQGNNVQDIVTHPWIMSVRCV